MFEGIYSKMLRYHASRQMPRRISIPDAVLGIGFAENMRSIPLAFFKGKTADIPIIEKIATVDDIMYAGKGKKVYAEMFAYEGYIGEGV